MGWGAATACVAGLGVVAALMGCAAVGGREPGREAGRAQVARVEAGRAEASRAEIGLDEPVGALDVFPQGPMVKTYEGRTRGRRGVTLERREITAVDDAGRWRVRLLQPDGEGWELVQELVLDRGAEGSVRLVELRDPERDSVMEFVPPMVLMGSTLRVADGVVRTTSKFTVRSLSRGSREKDRGEGSHEVEVVGAAGDGGPGWRVRTRLVLDLSVAVVTRERDLTISPGLGGRLEEERKRVLVGILTWEDTTRTLQWVDGPG